MSVTARPSKLRLSTLLALAALLLAPAACIDDLGSEDDAGESDGDDLACGEWSEPELIETGFTTLLDLANLGAQKVVLGDNGEFGIDGELVADPVELEPGSFSKVAYSRGYHVLVGKGGRVIRRSEGQTLWDERESATEQDLLGIATITLYGDMLAVSADELMVSLGDGRYWDLVEAPEGGWGQLRGIFADDGQGWLFGSGGVLWRVDSPMDEPVPQQLGATVDLVAGGSFGLAGSPIAVAASDRVFVRNSDTDWSEVPAAFEGEIVDFSAGFVVTSAGELYELSLDGEHSLITTFDFVPTAITGDPFGGLYIGGAEGQLLTLGTIYCI